MQTHQHLQQEPGRSGLILAFGILSILCLGPILGIPAWIMGRKDLNKIDKGQILSSERSLTKIGMILGIIATSLWAIVFIAMAIGIGTALFVGIDTYQQEAVQSNKLAIKSDITNIGRLAVQYYRHPKSMGGGGGSYIGYEIPRMFSETVNGSYSVNPRDNQIEIVGTSKSGDGTIRAIVNEKGVARWTFTGPFK
jgi:hypothetical protein